MTFLRDFFSRETKFDNGLKMFGTLHITISAVFLILYSAVMIYRCKLRDLGHFKTARCTMATVLLLNMLIHYTGRIAIGEWRLNEDLPLHICFAANLFMIYILYTDNRHTLFSVIYYFTMIGPLPAAVFPDLSRTWSGYLFWQFIISHHVMLLFSLYSAFVLEYKTDLKSAVRAFMFGNAYVALITIFNKIFGTNYIMLDKLPKQLYEAFPFLNSLPAFVWLESAGIIAIFTAWALNRIFRDDAPVKRSRIYKDA